MYGKPRDMRARSEASCICICICMRKGICIKRLVKPHCSFCVYLYLYFFLYKYKYKLFLHKTSYTNAKCAYTNTKLPIQIQIVPMQINTGLPIQKIPSVRQGWQRGHLDAQFPHSHIAIHIHIHTHTYTTFL